jgi:hypothetical protein
LVWYWVGSGLRHPPARLLESDVFEDPELATRTFEQIAKSQSCRASPELLPSVIRGFSVDVLP